MSLAADFDHHAHYWQQQKQLSADLHLLGTSPEAKQWLKQKPTRSNTRLIHQYNFQSQQYYQPPGSVKLVCSTTRSKSVSSCPSSSGINHDPSTNSNISCPDSAPVSPVDTRSRFDSTVACGTNITLPQQQQAMDPGLANVDDVASNGSSPAISRDLDQDHSDGHFYGHEQGVSSHISEGQSRKQKPRVGRLVMSRSKIPNPVITSVASLTSMDSNESSRCQGPGRHA
ncbi:hypothetical protein B0O80DRAFT_471792 [Mortierella sp. GBAus27b]|nr:hypothetical protein B0O80DRAFT_471792 [Mortierella sp. GBAus27b]